MNILVSSQKLSPLHLTNPSPWKPMIAPTNLPRIRNMQNQSNPSKKRNLQANAKGFTGIPPTSAIEEEVSPLTKRQNNSGNDDEEEIPQEVFERMMVRIVVSVGAPMALGLASMHLFGVVKEQQSWDVPKWILFLSIFLTFGASALGIAYGALSTSLDVNKKGSFLGLEEAQQNWVEMWKEEDEGKR